MTRNSIITLAAGLLLLLLFSLTLFFSRQTDSTNTYLAGIKDERALRRASIVQACEAGLKVLEKDNPQLLDVHVSVSITEQGPDAGGQWLVSVSREHSYPPAAHAMVKDTGEAEVLLLPD